MAFKRSAVRSRVAPPLIRLKKHYVYLNAETTKPSAMTAFLFVPGRKIIQNLSKIGTISAKG